MQHVLRAYCHNIYIGKLIVASGLIGALFNGLLIYGAKERSRLVILIWMVTSSLIFNFSIILIISDILFLSTPPPSISISKNGIKNNNITIGQEKLTLIAVLLMCGYIGFQIWAMSVANKARKDIKAEEQRIEQEFSELPVE